MLSVMQLNLARIKYNLSTALSMLTDQCAPDSPPDPSPAVAPRGELIRSVHVRLAPNQYERLRWIAPRCNMTMSGFARMALEVVMDHIEEENPHLAEDVPDANAGRDQSLQMSLFSTSESDLPAFIAQVTDQNRRMPSAAALG